MTETKQFDGTRASIRYHTLSMAMIRAMTTERLREQVQYIERQLTLWNQPLAAHYPVWFTEAARKWRAALNCEKRRVLMVLGERAEAEAAGALRQEAQG
jgi:hypothetical protein